MRSNLQPFFDNRIYEIVCMMDTEKAVRKTHVDPSEIKHISQFYENESNFLTRNEKNNKLID